MIGLLCYTPFPALAQDDTPVAPSQQQQAQQASQPTKPSQPLTPAQQAAAAAAAHRKALFTLGQEFAQTIGGELQQADLYLAGAGKMELAEHKSRTRLPDNEPLIMHATADDNKVFFNQDIYTIKRGHKLFVSLGDFCTSTDIAIAVHPSKGTADGWFIHEDQTFHLDAKKHEVTISGKTTSFDPKDVDTSDPDNLMVSTDLLEKWFGMSFDYDFAALNLLLTTTQPLPAEEAYARSLRAGAGQSWGSEMAKLPRQEVPYHMLSEPYVDVTTTTTVAKSAGAQATSTNNWSAITNGDLAGFNLQTFSSGNLPSVTGHTDPSVNPYLTNLRAMLGKQDPDGNLLGSLHATSYAVGDINTVFVPLISSGSQEQGATVSNAPTDIVTQTSTEIRGNAQPGWDVEMYRNNVYMSLVHVDATGLYDFQNVQLVLGDNDLKLLFYGPHGEINEEHRHVLVDPTLLAQHTGYYSASISRNNINTFNPVPGSAPQGPGTGDMNVAATYQYGLGKLGTLDFGVRRHSDNGVERTFSEGGLATFIGNTYINADMGIDNQTHAAAETLTARHNFGDQAGVLSYIWNSPGFNPTSTDTGAAVKNTASAALSGPLPGKFLYFDHLNYSASASHTQNYDGSSSISFAPTFSSRVSNLSLSGSVGYNRNTSSTGQVTDTETASFIGHGFVYGGNWRVTTNYNVKPIFQATQTDLEYDHSLGEKVDATTDLKYQNSPRLITASTALNWRASKATISPTLTVDSANNMTATVNVHFGTVADPYSHAYGLYNTYLSGVGGVAARVFYDKNGSGIYEPGDELMPDVVIKALQVHRSATTDTRGVAFIPDISNNIITDVVADNSTFRDSYDISLFAGVSIRTHPGSVTQLDFPVVTGGELDGQADYVDNKGAHKPASNLKLSLIAPDGTVEKSVRAASDGYYAISSIRPGVYYLTAKTDDEDSPNGFFLPRQMVFKPDGTTLFGQGIAMMPGYNTQFIYTSENAAPSGPRHTRVVRPEDIVSQKVLIRLGQYHSRLALTFSWYRFKMRSKWGEDFSLVKPLLDILPDPKTQVMNLDLQPNKPLTMEAAAQVCQILEENKFQCAVKVVTKYRDLTVSAGL